MRANIAAISASTPTRVNIKATTSEGLGFVGRGEGLACQAVVLIERRREYDSRDRLMSSRSLPCAHGGPAGAARLRAEPEDFVVDEMARLRARRRRRSPAAEGPQARREHDVGREAAGAARAGSSRATSASPASRIATPSPSRRSRCRCARRSAMRWLGAHGEGFEVLAAAAHTAQAEARRAEGQRFRRSCCASSTGDLTVAGAATASASRRRGVPNYFGPQRFGRDGGQPATRARAGSRASCTPQDRGSAASRCRRRAAAIFNAVLARAVRRERGTDCSGRDRESRRQRQLLRRGRDRRRAAKRVARGSTCIRPGRCGAAASLPTRRGRALESGVARGTMSSRGGAERVPARAGAARAAAAGTRARAGDRGRRDCSCSFACTGAFATAVLHELIDNASTARRRSDE